MLAQLQCVFPKRDVFVKKYEKTLFVCLRLGFTAQRILLRPYEASQLTSSCFFLGRPYVL